MSTPGATNQDSKATPDRRAWPPAYAVRVSARAKYARLRVLPGAGLEVVLPRHMRPESATDIVERHKDWICKTLNRVCGEDEAAGKTETVPFRIALRGGTEEYAVVCKGETPGDDPCVMLRASRGDATSALRELREWTRAYAARIIGGETAALAATHGLAYTSLRFRRQKSRWGSCTAKGGLSLNTCLIFLPPEMARLVVLHELAHTRHMDHGQGFWKTLFAMEPNALKLDKRLRSAWRFVPPWIWG